jgi:hypothetical protein
MTHLEKIEKIIKEKLKSYKIISFSSYSPTYEIELITHSIYHEVREGKFGCKLKYDSLSGWSIRGNINIGDYELYKETLKELKLIK